MRILQVVFSSAAAFEHKCQRVDFAALTGEHDVTQLTFSGGSLPVGGADIVHMYGGFRSVKAPVVSTVEAKKGWFSAGADVSVSPIEREGFTVVPEAVEEIWWGAGERQRTGGAFRIGSFGRPRLKSVAELTIARIHRTREDVEWLMFEQPPAPEQLADVDVWVDPVIEASDYDGFVAEALVSDLPVVASRTPINEQRLEKGRTGWLVPPNDPNELAHAILSALFKPEVAQQKIDAARQTNGKFRMRQRLRVLLSVYRSLVP